MPAETTTALAKVSPEVMDLAGTCDTASDLNEKLQKLQDVCHMVSPAPISPEFPEGFSVVVTPVLIHSHDTYVVGGKDALGKTALFTIGAAAGVTWNPQMSGRVDDASDPNYAHFRAAGMYRHFDGTPVMITGEKVMDLREGGATIQGMKVGELRTQRKFILEHAETKAKLRALRSMGIRTGYEKGELRKPFVVVKLVPTGRTNDPEMRREFARMRYASALGMQDAMYGGDGAPKALPPVQDGPGKELERQAPPPVQAAPETEQGQPNPERDPAAAHGAHRVKVELPKAFGGDGNKSLDEAPTEVLGTIVSKVDALLDDESKGTPEQREAAVVLRDAALAVLTERGEGPGEDNNELGDLLA